jgi:hypothetical protein
MGWTPGGHGLIGEVKHLVAMSTLEQLDRYVAEARAGGGLCAGQLIALVAYTLDVAAAVERRSDIGLWRCDRSDMDIRISSTWPVVGSQSRGSGCPKAAGMHVEAR